MNRMTKEEIEVITIKVTELAEGLCFQYFRRNVMHREKIKKLNLQNREIFIHIFRVLNRYFFNKLWNYLFSNKRNEDDSLNKYIYNDLDINSFLKKKHLEANGEEKIILAAIIEE